MINRVKDRLKRKREGGKREEKEWEEGETVDKHNRTEREDRTR